MKRALIIVLVIALAGVAFSGFLSWREFATDISGCTPVGPPQSIFGYPPCVYGLAMYSVLVVVAAIGLLARPD